MLLELVPLDPFGTAVPFSGTNYLGFEWFVPRTGLAALQRVTACAARLVLLTLCCLC